jgi:hypothetical protein
MTMFLFKNRKACEDAQTYIEGSYMGMKTKIGMMYL